MSILPTEAKLNIELASDTEIAVVGDIHEHDQQFFDLLNKVQPSGKRILVSVGDLFDKGFGYPSYEKISKKLYQLHQEGLAYLVRGNHEEKYLKRARVSGNWTQSLQWINQQSLILSFIWPNKKRLTVIHGGIQKLTTWQDLQDPHKENHLPYIRELDINGKYIPLIWKKKGNKERLEPKIENGKPWHEFYDGRFGYIASGHAAQLDGQAKFYPYSCNLDSGVYQTGILTCQIFNQNGLGELVTVQGVAAKAK